jgi:hypothetical protein
MSLNRLDLPFLPEALILARVVLLPLEAITVLSNAGGLHEDRVSGFRILGSGFKGSAFKKRLQSFNPERVIPPGRETLEPISLQSFNPERGTGNP